MAHCAILVFPAQAGVFLSRLHQEDALFCLPRASGGVSAVNGGPELTERSSPRKRGCFSGAVERRPFYLVFPAQAGVFLFIRYLMLSVPRLPRASGCVYINKVPALTAASSSPRKRGCFLHR